MISDSKLYLGPFPLSFRGPHKNQIEPTHTLTGNSQQLEFLIFYILSFQIMLEISGLESLDILESQVSRIFRAGELESLPARSSKKARREGKR